LLAQREILQRQVRSANEEGSQGGDDIIKERPEHHLEVLSQGRATSPRFRRVDAKA
jgi:hypothetical protein